MTHGGTGFSEPDLILTDNQSLIVVTGGNANIAYMGILSVLLEWHEQDPVDDLEQSRNDVVFSFQENRNPFIDHPEWVTCLFLDDCESCIDPACPADIDCNGDVGPADLAALLGAWGECPGCPSDLDGNGVVGPFDLAALLGAWGECR